MTAEDDLIRVAVRARLGGTPTPTQRRLLALELRALAEEQEATAEADDRSGVRVRTMLEREQANAAPHPKGGRPKGSGGRFVRIEMPADRVVVVHIARSLYQELGAPVRVSLERRGHAWTIRPGGRATGYAISWPGGAQSGLPRISAGRRQAADLGLVAGKHTAHIDAGAIVWT